jgi:hypothetical protein
MEARTMKTKILIALLAVVTLTAAKCKDGEPQDLAFDSPKCGDVTGLTVSYFVYGEGEMAIVPLSQVRPDSVFVVGLEPLSGFRDAQVTVTGTGAGSWISGSNTYNGLPIGAYPKEGMLEVGCVPNDPLGTEYKYMIEVTEGAVKNTLDPRAVVVKE